MAITRLTARGKTGVAGELVVGGTTVSGGRVGVGIGDGILGTTVTEG